jgi:hypothetical protein
MRRDWLIRQLDLCGRFGAFSPGEGRAHLFRLFFLKAISAAPWDAGAQSRLFQGGNESASIYEAIAV